MVKKIGLITEAIMPPRDIFKMDCKLEQALLKTSSDLGKGIDELSSQLEGMKDKKSKIDRAIPVAEDVLSNLYLFIKHTDYVIDNLDFDFDTLMFSFALHSKKSVSEKKFGIIKESFKRKFSGFANDFARWGDQEGSGSIQI